MKAKKYGLDTDHLGFKAAGWQMAIDSLARVFPRPINRDSCENRWRRIRVEWPLWEKHIQQVSNWNWDPERGTYVSIGNIMDDYFNTHPEMKPFRHRGPSHQELKRQLFRGRLASTTYVAGVMTTVTQMNGESNQQKRSQVAQSNGPEVISTVEPNIPASAAPITSAPAGRSDPPAAQSQKKASTSTASSAPRDRERDRPSKRARYTDLATAMTDVGDSILLSSRMLAQAISPYQRASREFLREMNDILPGSWKDSSGRIPLSKYSPFLRALSDPNNSITYIALMDCPKVDRFAFLSSIVDSEVLREQ